MSHFAGLELDPLFERNWMTKRAGCLANVVCNLRAGCVNRQCIVCALNVTGLSSLRGAVELRGLSGFEQRDCTEMRF